MLTVTLAISRLTTSNLPWFMDLTFQVPMQYCSLQHQTFLLSPVTSTTGYSFRFGSIPSFSLELFLHWSPVAYWAPTDLRSSSFSVLSFAFSYCSWDSQGKNTEVYCHSEVVCHSLPQWTTFCQTSPPWPVRPGWPHTAWLSVTESDKTVVLWSDWLVSCDYGFRVSALWCPLATPTISLGFLLPRMWGISSGLLQQCAAAAPYLGRGVSSPGRPSWPWTWGSSCRPSCARAAAAPWTRGCSSGPPPLTSGGVGKLLSAAPAQSQLGALPRHPWPWARCSSSRPWFCMATLLCGPSQPQRLPGIKPASPALKGEVITPGPPGKFLGI